MIQVPTLLIDENRVRDNVRRMVEKTNRCKILLRPHVKTPQSIAVGHWLQDEGISCITVSSARMASYFANEGWKDILIAFPVNILEMDRMLELADKIALGLVVVDRQTLMHLGAETRLHANIWVKIDVGTHRTGIDPAETDLLDAILDCFDQFTHLSFAGFLAHAGHSYQCRTINAVQKVYDESVAILTQLKQRYQQRFPDIKLSVGDTPSASLVEDAGPVDEWRAGNFIFYDLMQQQIGSCVLEDIAVSMACPVVATHPDRNQWILYGGGIHFAKDFILNDKGDRIYGRMVRCNGNNWTADRTMTDPYICALSQEHGIVQCSDETFGLYQPGDISYWLPVHSCMTADAMGSYTSLNGTAIDHFRKR